MLKDQKELLSAFNAHEVRYLVVGGHAAIAYGVEPTEQNSVAVFSALAAFGAPLGGISSSDFRDGPRSVVQFGQPPNRIDILQSIEGISFQEAWERRVIMQIDDTLTAPYLSLEQLIQNKEQVGRLSDLADVSELKKMRDLK
jgi:hypothetical protein